jgi:hypothetical protein
MTGDQHPSGKPEVDARALFAELASEACTSLFEAYGVHLRSIPPTMAPHSRALLSGIVAFTGPGIRGTCILAATEKPICQSNPIGGSLREWIAELSNQLVGRIKNKLLARGAEVYVTTPVVLGGEHLAPLPRYELEPMLFVTEGGTVFLWIEVEADADFRLSENAFGTPAREGEALLF